MASGVPLNCGCTFLSMHGVYTFSHVCWFHRNIVRDRKYGMTFEFKKEKPCPCGCK